MLSFNLLPKAEGDVELFLFLKTPTHSMSHRLCTRKPETKPAKLPACMKGFCGNGPSL